MQSEQYDTMVTVSFGQQTKGCNTSLSLRCTADNFPSLAMKAWHLLTLIHTLSSRCEMRGDVTAPPYAACVVCLLGFKEVCFSAEQPVLFAFSWRLIYPRCLSCWCHSYTAAKELLTSTEAGRCAYVRSSACLCVCVWGREIETGMTRGCLKSERKHSRALSSH